MTATSSTRLNTVSREFKWRTMDYEVHTVAEFAAVPGQYGVTLQDHPHSVVVGRKRVEGLVISSITRPGGNTSRFNFSGSPDLSTVQVGDYLHRKSCTSSANDGRDIITAVSDGSDYIEITDADGVAQGGAAGECAVSYSVRTSSALDDEPAAGEVNPDTRYGTGRVVHPSGDSGIDFVYQYEGGGTIGDTAIPDGSVTLAKLADLAESRMIGRAAGAGTGVPTALTPTQSWTVLGLIPITVDIGDYDMSAGAPRTKTITHGLSDHKKVRSIDVIVRDDADTNYYPLRSFDDSASSYTVGGVTSFTSTTVTISILGGSLFDSANFNATSYNRGWITFWVVP